SRTFSNISTRSLIASVWFTTRARAAAHSFTVHSRQSLQVGARVFIEDDGALAEFASDELAVADRLVGTIATVGSQFAEFVDRVCELQKTWNVVCGHGRTIAGRWSRVRPPAHCVHMLRRKKI